MKYLFILKTYLSLAYKVYWQSRRNTNKLFKEFNQHLKTERTLSKELEKRIFFYTAQCAITASWTCALRGKPLTRTEKKKVIYLGAITPILDDLTDTLQLTSSEILASLKSSKVTNNHEIQIVRYLYKQLQKVPNESFEETFKEALIAQDASIKQLEERKLSDSELKKIAYDKGGMFVLLYRIILSPKLKAGEKEALFTLGYALQQVNDMFDIYKDYINKQQTSYTNSKDINKNDVEYCSTVSKIITQFKSLDFTKNNIKKCLFEISTTTSRGMVCLNQLLLLQNNSQVFDIKSFTRKKLVCDMEKVRNIYKSFLYSVQFYEEIKEKAQEN